MFLQISTNTSKVACSFLDSAEEEKKKSLVQQTSERTSELQFIFSKYRWTVESGSCFSRRIILALICPLQICAPYPSTSFPNEPPDFTDCFRGYTGDWSWIPWAAQTILGGSQDTERESWERWLFHRSLRGYGDLRMLHVWRRYILYRYTLEPYIHNCFHTQTRKELQTKKTHQCAIG